MGEREAGLKFHRHSKVVFCRQTVLTESPQSNCVAPVMWCQLLPAPPVWLKHYGGALMCVCMWVCGIKHHRVHIGALQKSYLQRSEKRPPPLQPTLSLYTHTHAAAGTTYCTEQRGPTALPYLTHTNTPAHMRFISTVFKVQRTGNHYESVPLTPTLRDEKLHVWVCVFHCYFTATQTQRKLLNLLLTNTNDIH